LENPSLYHDSLTLYHHKSDPLKGEQNTQTSR